MNKQIRNLVLRYDGQEVRTRHPSCAAGTRSNEDETIVLRAHSDDRCFRQYEERFLNGHGRHANRRRTRDHGFMHDRPEGDAISHTQAEKGDSQEQRREKLASMSRVGSPRERADAGYAHAQNSHPGKDSRIRNSG